MQHKAGFVNIIGNPNVGKSTLMNLLIGEKLSIITAKAQTTRHRILGLINGADYQIVFSDTPGIIKPKYKLQESMMDFVSEAFDDADVMIYVTDIIETADKNIDYVEKLNKLDIPVIIIINKIDLSNQKDVLSKIDYWKNLVPKSIIIPTSAIHMKSAESIVNEIVSHLPVSPEYYPKDQLTDKPERFFVSEIIREKIFTNYQKEIPYSVEVEIESFKEEEKITNIKAVIFVSRDSQKGILIGKAGESLKKVGKEARIDIEKFLDKKVFLEIFVKVRKDWRDNDRMLKGFGYKS